MTINSNGPTSSDVQYPKRPLTDQEIKEGWSYPSWGNGAVVGKKVSVPSFAKSSLESWGLPKCGSDKGRRLPQQFKSAEQALEQILHKFLNVLSQLFGSFLR